jgi:hypothetical protein
MKNFELKCVANADEERIEEETKNRKTANDESTNQSSSLSLS